MIILTLQEALLCLPQTFTNITPSFGIERALWPAKTNKNKQKQTLVFPDLKLKTLVQEKVVLFLLSKTDRKFISDSIFSGIATNCYNMQVRKQNSIVKTEKCIKVDVDPK